jgi:hypothetical protein
MKFRISRYSALAAVAVCVLSGCAGAPRSGVERHAADVKFYEPEQLAQGQYELVRYLWVDSWRTAFWLPSASSEAAGIASLQAEAARLGANGLINVSCRDQGHFMWSRSREPAILCYGNAIRVR